ncbi:hypothetical protein GCM10027020_03900 [Nocardioides salsibiostraticola]
MTPGTATILLALAASAVLGVVLAEIGLRTGPWLLAGLMVLPVLGWVAIFKPHALVGGFALVLPVGLLSLGPLEVVQLAMVLVVMFALTQATLRRTVVLPPWQVGVPLLAMLLAAALATTGARDPDAAFRLDIRLLLGVLLVVTMTTVLLTTRHVHQVVGALSIAGGVISAWALLTLGDVTPYLDGAVVSNRALGPFGQPNELGLVAAALLVLTAGLGLATSSLATRLLCAVSAALLLGALLLSFSRGGWIGASVGLVSLAVLDPSSRRTLARLVGFGAGSLVLLTVLGSSLSMSLAARLSSIREPSSNPYDDRPLIWTEALRQIQDRPLTGQGPGAFPTAAQSAPDSVGLPPEHAHQLLLTVTAEYGLFGLAALLALVGGLVFLGTGVRVARASEGNGRFVTLQPALVASLVAIATHGVLDYPLRNAAGNAMVWLLVGLLVAQLRIVRQGSRPESAADLTLAKDLRT